MNMKKITNLILIAACVAAAAAASCTSQDDIYKEWVKKGGYDYPAKPINLTSVSGYQNVTVSWEKPMDPAVRTATLYWDNYANSQSIDYADYPDGKVSINVKDLEDRSYTFDVVNFDESQNKSLASEITVSPYGDSWMVSRSQRTVKFAEMDEDGKSATVILSKSTDEMIATRFRYKDRNEEWVDCETVLTPGRDTVVFPNAMKGKRFEYSSSYCPSNGKDTVWSSWQKSVDGISYKIDASRWNVSVTNGQSFGINTPDKVVDGKYNRSAYSWHSSKSDDKKGVFPKILTFNTMASAGEEYSFTRFVFCENTEASSLRYIKDLLIYVGDSSYNPDDTDYQNNFGIPFLSSQLGTSSAMSSVSATQGASGQYLAVVFKNSWNNADGFIDLWELIPYGYLPSMAD